MVVVRSRDLSALASRDLRVSRRARDWSSGANRSGARSGLRFETTTTGPGRYRDSAIRAPGCSSSDWHRPRTAGIAPAACSPVIVRATSCSRRCSGAASPISRRRSALDDGLELHDAYIAAAVRCAPPANKPTPAERDECAPFLERELELLAARACDRRAGQLRLRGGVVAAARSRTARTRCRNDARVSRTVSKCECGPVAVVVRVPSQPAEHVHRPPDRAACSTRCSPGPGELRTEIRTAR